MAAVTTYTEEKTFWRALTCVTSDSETGDWKNFQIGSPNKSGELIGDDIQSDKRTDESYQTIVEGNKFESKHLISIQEALALEKKVVAGILQEEEEWRAKQLAELEQSDEEI